LIDAKEHGTIPTSVCFTGKISPDGEFFFKNSKFRQKTHHQKFFLSPKIHPIWPFFIHLSKFLSIYVDSIQNLDGSAALLFHWCHMLDK
jgi:hypothetical protein